MMMTRPMVPAVALTEILPREATRPKLTRFRFALLVAVRTLTAPNARGTEYEETLVNKGSLENISNEPVTVSVNSEAARLLNSRLLKMFEAVTLMRPVTLVSEVKSMESICFV